MNRKVGRVTPLAPQLTRQETAAQEWRDECWVFGSMKIQIARKGEPIRLLSIVAVRGELKSGSLTPQNLACWEGARQWMPLGKLPLVTEFRDDAKLSLIAQRAAKCGS